MSRVKYAILLVGLQACAAPRGVPQSSGTTPAPAVAAAPAPAAESAPHAPEELEEAEDYEDYDEPLNDDGGDEDDVPPEKLPPAAKQAPHPLAELSDEQLETMLQEDPASLGPLSLGRPNAGALMNGIEMPAGDMWEVVNPKETWGTPETVEYIERAIKKVNKLFPDTKPLPIGDISDEDGGHLSPHISHQAGRDVDIGYYYTTDDKWYTTATGDNLDLPRTWAFVKAFITETDVEAMFIDRRVQKLLRDYATSIGEDEAWLDSIFGGPRSSLHPLISHEPGHRSHIHVRFYNPVAQESGRRVYRKLLALKMIKPPTYYVHYKVKRGDTLIRIARKFKTSVKALKKANRMRSNRIIAGHSYKIPRRGGVQAPQALVLPERRVPPPRVARTPEPVADATPPPADTAGTRTAEAGAGAAE